MWGTPLRRVTVGGQGGRQPRANTEPKRLIEARPRWAGLERQKVPLRNGTEQEAVVFQITHRTGDLSDGERRQRSADTVKVHPAGDSAASDRTTLTTACASSQPSSSMSSSSPTTSADLEACSASPCASDLDPA